MQFVRPVKLLAFASATALLLSACDMTTNQASNDYETEGNAPGIVTGGLAASQENGPFLGKKYSAQAPLNQMYHFGLNKSDVHNAYLTSLEVEGQYLASHPDARVRVDGHTDERGSREYNVALGERRADAIAKALELNGASPKQVVVVSYGKERPVELAHDELAYRVNRRVELIYEKKD